METLRLPLRRWSVEEFHRMAEVGVLSPRDRVELINGEIFKMSPVAPRHAACVRRIWLWLSELLGRDAMISVQSPLALGFAEPYPDVALLRWRDDLYTAAHPTAADTLLVIEVGDPASESYAVLKRDVYARAGIGEFWIVDLSRDAVSVLASPVEGRYLDAAHYGRGDSWRSPALGGRQVTAEDVLGPADG
jgi:Uma2 family endonuclease